MALQRLSTSSSQNQSSAGAFHVFPPHPARAVGHPRRSYPHPRVFTFLRFYVPRARSQALHSRPSPPARPWPFRSTLHGRPQPLFAPCSSPVPRAGSRPASPTAALQRHRTANLLLYQVEQATTSTPPRAAEDRGPHPAGGRDRVAWGQGRAWLLSTGPRPLAFSRCLAACPGRSGLASFLLTLTLAGTELPVRPAWDRMTPDRGPREGAGPPQKGAP
jgi:hypothetical protein